MGLYVCHLETVTIEGERALYVYLLDYGWPEGQWEHLFKKHFMRMADRALETGAVVIGSSRGVHFANEVLSYHHVGGLAGEDVIPGLLITKTHPRVFRESYDEVTRAGPGMETLLVVPLKPFCSNEDEFIRAIEQVFKDLKSGTELEDFAIARHDPRLVTGQGRGRRFIDAIELKPGAFGVSFNIKKALGL